MVERTGGAGGVGAIASDNTELRGPRYAPHINLSKATDFTADVTHVMCLDCGVAWRHPRGRWEGLTPTVCSKAPQAAAEQASGASEDPALAELNKKWRSR